MRKSVYTRGYTTLRERLVAARQAIGLTQSELARKLGKHQSFVAKYEGGERRIDVVELVEIARLLQIDLLRLLRAIETATE